MSRTLTLMALAGALWLAGCSLLVDEPVVRVTDIQAASIGLTGGTLRVMLEVENPNGFPLVSNVFVYRLEVADDAGAESVAWTTLFDGEHPGTIEIGSEEVGRIAHFIAEQDPDIPYALLGFGPHFLMPDLPRTSVRHAEAALETARDAGLRRVRVGNRSLLGESY